MDEQKLGDIYKMLVKLTDISHSTYTNVMDFQNELRNISSALSELKTTETPEPVKEKYVIYAPAKTNERFSSLDEALERAQYISKYVFSGIQVQVRVLEESGEGFRTVIRCELGDIV